MQLLPSVTPFHSCRKEVCLVMFSCKTTDLTEYYRVCLRSCIVGGSHDGPAAMYEELEIY